MRALKKIMEKIMLAYRNLSIFAPDVHLGFVLICENIRENVRSKSQNVLIIPQIYAFIPTFGGL